MPGTPTSRACDSCRKRRKRCDQVQPTCSRCQRLKVPCVGGGSQRFVFKNYNVGHLSRATQSNSLVAPVPSSPPMAICMSLVSKLKTRHLRYNMNWAHGSFMDEIPRRLGHSEALAASTEAFMLAIPCEDPSYTLVRRRLRSYTAAITATRLALLHPVEAYSLNTLCAVYLLWICQCWSAVPDDTGYHPKGLALLLNEPIRFDPSEKFDRGVVYVACTVVTSEKMLTGSWEVDPSSQCWSFFNRNMAQTANVRFTQPAGVTLALASRLSRLLMAIADFFRSDQALSKVWDLYSIATKVVADLSPQHTRFTEAASNATSDENDLLHAQRTQPNSTAASSSHDFDLRGFKFALTLTLVINNVLSKNFPECESLATFRRRYTNEALPIALKAEQIMPMGAGFMGMFWSHVREIEENLTAPRAAWDTYGTEFSTRRSAAFSQILESTLESLL